MSAIDPKYKGQDDFKLIEELQKVSGTELPNAIKEIMNAEIRHNTERDVGSDGASVDFVPLRIPRSIILN